MNNFTFACFLLAFLMLGCIEPQQENKQIKTELYFGLSNSAGPIPEADWQTFKTDVIENILSGFTELRGDGYWQSSSGQKYREKSAILIYIHENSGSENQKIDSLITLFKTKFDQESVLQIDQEVDINFK
ncbi:MAG: DUF3574 domain-containing protein [Bacteroidota bacterium]